MRVEPLLSTRWGQTTAYGEACYNYFTPRFHTPVGEIARQPGAMGGADIERAEQTAARVRADIEALMNWNPQAEPDTEIAFRPARVLMQDFTGVPAVVDLAAMRDAMQALGGDPEKINPLQPAELVIDHSVQVDAFGSSKPTA